MEDMESVLMELASLDKNPQTDKIPQPLEDYLAYVAKSGNALFAWSKVKPLFRRKLEIVIQEFQETSPTDNLPLQPNVDVFKFDQMKERIFEQLESYTGIPFTVQRLCELLVQPQKHYKRTDKFMRGLEKIMLVVSTIDPNPNVQKEEETPQSIVKQSPGAASLGLGESPSKRIRLESAEPDNEPGPCDSADEMSVAANIATNGHDQSNEAGPSTEHSTQASCDNNTSDDNMDIDTECSSSEAKLSLPSEQSSADDTDTGVESSGSAGSSAKPGDQDATTSEAGDKEGGAESSDVVSMEVEPSDQGVDSDSGVSTSHGQPPAQPAPVPVDSDNGASSSGQDNVTTQQNIVNTETDSREAVPADTEETTETSEAATEKASTATEQTVGHSQEVGDSNVESSQDTQQSSSSSVSMSDISPGAADSSDQASSAAPAASDNEPGTSEGCDNAASTDTTSDIPDTAAASSAAEDSSSVSQSQPSTVTDKSQEPSDDNNSPDTSSTS